MNCEIKSERKALRTDEAFSVAQLTKKLTSYKFMSFCIEAMASPLSFI